jgi:hypothetical protein
MTLRAWICGLVLALSSLAAGGALALDPPALAASPLLQLADVAPPPIEPEPEPLTSEPEPSAAGEPTPIDGRWRVGQDMIVELKGGIYQLFSNGEALESGTYTFDGEAITTRSADGTEDRGRLTRIGDLILLEPDDEIPILMHAETPAGTAAGGGSVEGRWRTAFGDYVELVGGATGSKTASSSSSVPTARRHAVAGSCSANASSSSPAKAS